MTVSATGGTPPYQGTGTFSVPAGTYSYTVTDANSCTQTTTGNITQPTALVPSSSNTAILCNGGNSIVTVSATGGTRLTRHGHVQRSCWHLLLHGDRSQ